MVYVVSVAYPTGKTVNHEYYLEQHMPLVKNVWGPMGLESYQVVDFSSPDAPYTIQTHLNWKSKEAADAAMVHPDSKPVFADIPNFYDGGMPHILSGKCLSKVIC